MKKINQIHRWQGPGNRPETGALQFGDDWPGVFIRGDNALYYAIVLRHFLAQNESNDYKVSVIKGLISDLESCREGGKDEGNDL